MSNKTPSFSVNKYEEIFKSPIFINQNGEWYKQVNYQDTLDLIRENIQSAAGAVVSIGYYLKHLNKNNLFKDGGYETIWECAKEEFGITRGTASRYMDMNDLYSINGDSPLIDEKYKEFNKGQLQELLYLPEETREQTIESISPAETVKGIRNIVAEEKAKQEPSSKEIYSFYEYVKLSEQPRSSWKDYLQDRHGKSYHDFLGGSIDYRCTPRGISINNHDEITWHRCVQLLNEYIPDQDAIDEDPNKCATSHILDNEQLPGQMKIHDYPEVLPDQKELPVQQEKDSEVFHFIDAHRGVEDAYGATLATIVSEYLSLINEEKVETIHEISSVTFKALGKEYTAKLAEDKNKVIFYDSSDRAFMDVESVRLQKEYEYWYPEVRLGQSKESQKHCPHEHDGCNRHCCVDMECMDYDHCCADCPVPCNAKCGWIKDNGWIKDAGRESDDSQVINVEPEEIKPVLEIEDAPIKSIEQYPESLTNEEVKVLKEQIGKIKETLESMGTIWKENQPLTYTKYTIQQTAYELMLQHGKPVPDQQPDMYDPDSQPELPVLKNMDAREEFVLGYESWPLWCKNELTEETFYRYNLPDGSAIVVRHYPYMPEWRNEECTGKVLYLLKPKDKHFKDGETNMTCIKEHLKEVQKKK